MRVIPAHPAITRTESDSPSVCLAMVCKDLTCHNMTHLHFRVQIELMIVFMSKLGGKYTAGNGTISCLNCPVGTSQPFQVCTFFFFHYLLTFAQSYAYVVIMLNNSNGQRRDIASATTALLVAMQQHREKLLAIGYLFYF